MSSDEEASVRKITDFDDEVDNFSILSTSPPRHNPSRRTTNTGPKGVRADARAYEAAKREAAANKTRKQSLLTTGSLGVSGESGSEASEDEWMSRWREKRMKELSKSGVAGVNCFGQVDDVDANGYLKAVDFDELEDDDEVVVDDYSAAAKRARARRNVVTVVLIWDSSTDSKRMFQVFSKLARQYPTTHFLRLSAQYAEDMPSSALPAVLAYRRGELISNLVHFAEELDPGSEITIPTVEAFLIREDILRGEEPESDASM